MATEEAPATRDERPLQESLDDAGVLLWYATREGKTLPDGTVKTIVDAQSRLSGGARDPAIESAFWLAFRNLATAVHPVSVDSVLATYSYPFGVKRNRRSFGDATATKRKYSLAAVLTLCCLLVVQVYWFVGDTFRSDLESHREELDRITGSLRQMRFETSALDDLIRIKEQQVQQAVSVVNPNATDLGDIERVQWTVETLTAEIEGLRDQQTENRLNFENNRHRADRVNIVLEGDKALLDWWDFFTELIGTAAYKSPQLDLSPSFPGLDRTATDGASSGQFDRELAIAERSLIDRQLKVELSLLSSKSMLAILNQYLLPLLYGLLGSLAYILRTLSTEIQNVTFTRGSDIRYSLRWPLGMLGGVTVGLFFDPADLTGLAAVTPLGLAFLAGYGVELVFTGLDRLVRAFAGDEAARSKPAAG